MLRNDLWFQDSLFQLSFILINSCCNWNYTITTYDRILFSSSLYIRTLSIRFLSSLLSPTALWCLNFLNFLLFLGFFNCLLDLFWTLLWTFLWTAFWASSVAFRNFLELFLTLSQIRFLFDLLSPLNQVFNGTIWLRRWLGIHLIYSLSNFSRLT